MDKPEFKAVKVDPVDGTFLYIKFENETPPDQQELYLEESKEDLKALLEDEKICQLCKQICTHGFMPVKDLKSELTRNLNIPEVSFGPTNEPVICSSCFDTLIFQGTVINNSTHGRDKISNTSEGKEGGSFIKIEPIEIKSEDSEDESTSGCDDVSRRSQTNQNRQVTCKTLPDDQGPALEDSSKKPKFKCDKCAYQSKYRSHHIRHLLSHKDKSEVRIYKCHRCPYETKYKYSLKNHGLRHTSTSETMMYTCKKCPYKDTCMMRLVRHQQQHKTASDEMFKCGDCNYTVRYKKLLDRHRMMHAVVPQVMFKCDKCNYETKLECNLKLHQIRHRVYKCGTCAYESERKEDIERHRAIHEGEGRARTRK